MSSKRTPEENKIIQLRKLGVKDLLETVIRLRRLLAAQDAAAIMLYANFDEIGPDLEKEAVKARRHIEAAAAKIYTLLTEIEKTEAYSALKAQAE